MITLVAYLVADALVRVLPETVANSVARAVGRFAFALRVPARKRLEANLARLHGADARRIRAQAQHSFEQFAVALADFLRLGHTAPERLSQRLAVQGRENLDAAFAAGRGVIVLTAHVGSWDWGGAYLASQGKRLHVVIRPQANRRVERFLRRRREAWGMRYLDRRPTWIDAARALRAGHWVALLGDRRAPDLGSSLCAWAGALARRTGAVILPAAMHRQLKRAPGQWFAFEPLPDGLA